MKTISALICLGSLACLPLSAVARGARGTSIRGNRHRAEAKDIQTDTASWYKKFSDNLNAGGDDSAIGWLAFGLEAKSIINLQLGQALYSFAAEKGTMATQFEADYLNKIENLSPVKFTAFSRAQSYVGQYFPQAMAETGDGPGELAAWAEAVVDKCENAADFAAHPEKYLPASGSGPLGERTTNKQAEIKTEVQLFTNTPFPKFGEGLLTYIDPTGQSQPYVDYNSVL